MVNQIGGALEKYLDLLAARQKLVAANVANADTPGYHTQDIDFQHELERAVSGGGGSPRAREAPGLTARNDGNNVSLDRESRLMAENAMRFNVASMLLKSQLRSIRLAIQEGKNG